MIREGRCSLSLPQFLYRGTSAAGRRKSRTLARTRPNQRRASRLPSQVLFKLEAKIRVLQRWKAVRIEVQRKLRLCMDAGVTKIRRTPEDRSRILKQGLFAAPQ